MGAIYVGMLDTFNAGRAKTALVHSLMFAVCYTFGVVCGFLITKFGISVVTYTAAILTAAGFLASFFATSIYQLYGFISVVTVKSTYWMPPSLVCALPNNAVLGTGMGIASMYISSVVCVGWTFTGSQKSMALALQSLGTAISGFMWPNLLTASIESYGLRGTYLILCGIFLHNVPLAILFSCCGITPKSLATKTNDGETNEGFDMSIETRRRSRSDSVLSAITEFVIAASNKKMDTIKEHSDERSRGIETGENIGKYYDNGNNNENDCDKSIIENDSNENVINQDTNAKHFSENDSNVNVTEKSQKDGCEFNAPCGKTSEAILFVTNETKAFKKNSNNSTPASAGKGQRNDDRPSVKQTCFSKLGLVYALYCIVGVLEISAIAGFLTVYQDINVFNGLTIKQSDLTFMSYSLLNIISRFLPLIPARFPKINSFVVPIISSICGGIGQLIFLINTSFLSTMVAMAITAISDGGWVAAMQAILFEILPQEYQATGFGFMFTCIGIAVSATGPLFGAIRDGTSSYQAVLITTTTMLFTSALLEIICLFLTLRSKQRKYIS